MVLGKLETYGGMLWFSDNTSDIHMMTCYMQLLLFLWYYRLCSCVYALVQLQTSRA
jgi:hypothetical protein